MTVATNQVINTRKKRKGLERMTKITLSSSSSSWTCALVCVVVFTLLACCPQPISAQRRQLRQGASRAEGAEGNADNYEYTGYEDYEYAVEDYEEGDKKNF